MVYQIIIHFIIQYELIVDKNRHLKYNKQVLFSTVFYLFFNNLRKNVLLYLKQILVLKRKKSK